MNIRTVVVAITVALAGCTTVPMGDLKQDVALKQFKVAPGKAGIFVFRNETIGAAIRMDVLVDGLEIGSTAANTYLYQEVLPGKHRITSKAENSDSVDVDVPAGMNAFVWQEVKMGFRGARTKLHVVTEQEGTRGVRETQLAVQ